MTHDGDQYDSHIEMKYERNRLRERKCRHISKTNTETVCSGKDFLKQLRLYTVIINLPIVLNDFESLLPSEISEKCMLRTN
jgi:hypothetical protein